MSNHTEEIRARVNAWWRSRQDDFVKEVRGAGDDTHALYDVPAALAEYTCNYDRELQALREEVERVRGLVSTMWLHAGYQDCGYLQMTSAQKVLYNEIIERSDKDAAERYGFSAVEQLAALSSSPAQEQK